MNRKVLFSFLGLSEYIPCYYTHKNFKSSFTRFIQTAITEYILRENDHLEVVVFVTKEAEERNWNNRMNKDGKHLEGLEEAFQRITPHIQVKKVVIPGEQDEQSNWKLFDLILNEVHDQDQIFFDVTHSFRTIPLISLIVLNYARLLKNATIGGLMYGLFEKLGGPIEVDQMPNEARLAPIIDFSEMSELLDWTNGISQYLDTGNAKLIRKLTNKERAKIYKTTEVQKDDISVIQQLSNISSSMQRVNVHFETSRGRDIPKEVDNLLSNIQSLQNIETDHMRALVPLVEKVKEKLAGYEKDEATKNIFMTNWCIEHGLIQQGFTLLQENVITAFCKYLNICEMNRLNREAVSAAINVHYIPKQKWKGSPVKIQLMGEVLEKTKKFSRYYQFFDTLTKFRNDLNHAQWQKEAREPNRFKNELRKLSEEFELFFREVYAEIENRR